MYSVDDLELRFRVYFGYLYFEKDNRILRHQSISDLPRSLLRSLLKDHY